ncbi:hypothetical protein BRADI_4g23140v3 [Brachypodium distachyon]|uniref:F-box domain-containing protein n=1 Tax=Brachypodium distachyon TaxID=15368 RepID=A0A2K2CPL8_BRADI|nr:hypothetical protein BRADI_4g23140v3 [Brachypodium distachyon]
MSERTKNNEESNETSEDHISALPDDLLLDVLSLLTADEAVQTCVLARRWRDLWRYLPSLSFVVEKPSAEAPTFRSTEHFNEFVNRLIALREPLPLVDCEIDLYQTDTSEFNNDETFPYPYLNQWIEYALTCQAQFLRVIVDDRIDQKFLLNVPLVSRHLMTLHLNNVDLLCSMDFSSCTPVLEDLEVSSCDIHARTVSSRSLKHLYIVNCHFSIGYRTLFSTPSLNSLHLAYFDGMIPLTESMPLLERAFVRLEFSSDHRYCINFAVEDCGDQSRVGCFGYPNQSVLLNGLSNAINLVLIAGPEEASASRRSRSKLIATSHVFEGFSFERLLEQLGPSIPAPDVTPSTTDGHFFSRENAKAR